MAVISNKTNNQDLYKYTNTLNNNNEYINSTPRFNNGVFSNSNNNVENVDLTNNKKINKLPKSIEVATATGSTVINAVRYGEGKVVEGIVDGLAIGGSYLIKVSSIPSSAIIGFFSKDTKKKYDSVFDDLINQNKQFIAEDIVGDINEHYYTETERGKRINESSKLKYDSEEIKKIQDVSQNVSGVVAATAITIATGGAAAGVVGGVYGTGKAAENTYKETIDTNALQKAGIIFSGALTGLSWGANGKIVSSFIKNAGVSISSVGIKETASNLAKSVTNKEFVKTWLKASVKDPGNYIASGMMSAEDLVGFINGEKEFNLKNMALFTGGLVKNFGLNVLDDGLRMGVGGFDASGINKYANKATETIGEINANKLNDTLEDIKDEIIITNEKGLIDSRKLPLSKDDEVRKVQEKILNNEPLSLSEKLKLRDGAVTKINDVELHSDHMYRATSVDAVKDYIKTNAIKDNGSGKGYAAVNWYLGGTAKRYGKVVIETPADANLFKLADDYGGHMSGNPLVRQAHSSNTDPVTFDKVTRIIFLDDEGKNVLKVIEPSKSSDLLKDVELGDLLFQQNHLLKAKNKLKDNFSSEMQQELNAINNKIDVLSLKDNYIKGIKNDILNGNKKNFVFYHGGLEPDFDIDNLDLLRQSQKQGSKYAGFYMYNELNKKGAIRYANQQNDLEKTLSKGIGRFEISGNAKVYEMEDGFGITRLSKERLQELKNEGYDIVLGKMPIGGTEYVLLNKDKIVSYSFENLNNNVVLEKNKLLNLIDSDELSLENFKKALGGDKLNEVFDDTTINFIYEEFKENKTLYQLDTLDKSISDIQSLLNHKIPNNLTNYYSIKPEYILKLSTEEQNIMAKSFANGNTELENCLKYLWKNKIGTHACQNVSDLQYISFKTDANNLEGIQKLQKIYGQQDIDVENINYNNNTNQFEFVMRGKNLYKYISDIDNLNNSKSNKNLLIEIRDELYKENNLNKRIVQNYGADVDTSKTDEIITKINKLIDNVNFKEEKIDVNKINDSNLTFNKFLEKMQDGDDMYFGADQNSTRKYIIFSVKDTSWIEGKENEFVDFVVSNNLGSKKIALENMDLIKNNGEISTYGKERIEKFLLKQNDNDVEKTLSMLDNVLELKNNDEYNRQINILINKGLNKEDAQKVMEGMDLVDGNCSFAAGVNSIFKMFYKKEEKFKKTFGFDMYQEIDGKTRLNTNQMMLELYTFINSNKNMNSGYSDIEKKFNFDSNGKLQLIDFNNNRIPCSSANLQLFLKSNNIDYSYEQYSFKFDDDIKDVKDTLNSVIKDGDSVRFNIKSVNPLTTNKLKTINFYQEDGTVFVSTDTWSEGTAHSVFMTKLYDDKMEISSWGEKLYIKFDDLMGNTISFDKDIPGGI